MRSLIAILLLVATASGAGLPSLSGICLDGSAVSLPDDLKASRTVILMAFERDQQPDIDTWVPVVKALQRPHPSMAWYEIPLVGDVPGVLQRVILNGMREQFEDPALQAHIMPMFVDREPVMQALGVTKTEDIWVLVLDERGEIVWATAGTMTAERVKGLKGAL